MELWDPYKWRYKWVTGGVRTPKVELKFSCNWPLKVPSLKLTFSHLKMDGWKTILSFWDAMSFFLVRTLNFREAILFCLVGFARMSEVFNVAYSEYISLDDCQYRFNRTGPAGTPNWPYFWQSDAYNLPCDHLLL